MRGERLIEWTDPASVLRHVHELERTGQGSDDSENWKKWAELKIAHPDCEVDGLFIQLPGDDRWHLSARRLYRARCAEGICHSVVDSPVCSSGVIDNRFGKPHADIEAYCLEPKKKSEVCAGCLEVHFHCYQHAFEYDEQFAENLILDDRSPSGVPQTMAIATPVEKVLTCSGRDATAQSMPLIRVTDPRRIKTIYEAKPRINEEDKDLIEFYAAFMAHNARMHRDQLNQE